MLNIIITTTVILSIIGCGKHSVGDGTGGRSGRMEQVQNQEQTQDTEQVQNQEQTKSSDQTQNQKQTQSSDQTQKQEGQKESGKEKAAVDHLLTVWTDYLQTMDHLYGSELWALDYTQAFLESSEWSDLSKARTACIASARYLTDLSMTEEDLTGEEYLVLAKAGMDTAYQSVEFQSVQALADGAHQEVRDRLLVGLEGDVFSTGSIEVLKKETAAFRDAITYMCRYHCAITNYMLLTLKDEERSADYWKTMQENCPVLAAAGYEWLHDETGIKDHTEKILDDYEAIQARQADILSALKADLYRMGQIIENNDIGALAASVHSISGAPVLLPAPVWYDPENAKYLSYVRQADERILYPESGDELTEDVYGTYIQMENVSRTDMDEYRNRIRELADDVWEKEGDTWYIAMPGYQVQMQLEDGHATILFVGQDITFAPDWYLAMQGN